MPSEDQAHDEKGEVKVARVGGRADGPEGEGRDAAAPQVDGAEVDSDAVHASDNDDGGGGGGGGHINNNSSSSSSKNNDEVAEKKEEDEDEDEDEDEEEAKPERAFPADPERAAAAKAKGNSLYQAGEYEAAAEAYSDALDYVPDEDAEDRAVYLSNRAACFFMMKMYDEAVADCTPAIELKPKYLKCIKRRARAYEELDKLADSLEDWKAVAEADPHDREARAKTVDVARRLEAQREKQKEEMLGKLKELGNGLLGKFGLSLDNFNAVKDPNTGSYSISFGQQGKDGQAGGGGGAGPGGKPA